MLDGFELSAPAAELARTAVPDARRIEVYDGETVPAEDSEYDLAILSHVIEHVERPVPLLAEAARVAHEVLVEVPLEDNRSGRRPANLAESERIGHLHLFERSDVRALIAEAGLVVEAELTDPLPYAHHAFRAPRAKATAKWAVRKPGAPAVPAHGGDAVHRALRRAGAPPVGGQARDEHVEAELEALPLRADGELLGQ